jgi:exonuclease SbcC
MTPNSVTMLACLIHGACSMFGNVFKKDVALIPAAAMPPGGSPALSPGGAPHQTGAQPLSGNSEAELQVWREKILAAKADDRALLQLAHQAPGVDLKLTALEALTQEDALKQAMREFRDQDKRLHRAAKSRWQATVAKREAITEARVLIAGAYTLIERERIPANRLVELDRAWAALNVAFLDEALVTEFAALRAQLGARVRERGEGEQALARWLAATDNAIRALTASLAGVAQGGTAPTSPIPSIPSMPSNAPATLAAALLQLLKKVPGVSDVAIDARCIEKTDAANHALALASCVVQRAEFLQSLPATGVADEPDEKVKIEQWRSFPGVSEGELQTLLARRFSDWRNARSQERQRDHDARRTHERELSAEQRKQRLGAMQRHVELAEAAHAAGQVAELTRLMAVIDNALRPGPVNAALAKRIESLRQEQARLRDWQRWGGGQRREQLVAEAQVLAQIASEKVALKAHADAIDKLRERWKELDKLGGATSKALWLAFDGALKAAYVPVAAHLDKLKIARNENLVARNQVIDGLIQAGAKFFPAAPVEGDSPAPASAAGSQPDWRAIARTLEEAKIAWRKLGPVEHTVPRKAQKGDNAVTMRYAAALQALEAPLTQAYREASQQREQLIAAAKNLGGSEALARDVVDRVRALQTQWQAHAKALPLPRREENTSWRAFKTATDAIFTARDAARAARETESSEQIKLREAIIDSLLALPATNSTRTASEIKRALANAETAWRACAEVPRPHAARLDARYRAARDAATKRLRDIADHAAQARFDALIATMALCHEREAAGEVAPDLEARWSAIENLPDAWKPGMEARFRGIAAPKAGPKSGPRSGMSSDAGLPDTLLNLEVACGLDTPSEFTAARQHLKMRALKNAMEGRQAGVTTPADIERGLLDAAATPRPDEVSRERLEKIVAAVRVRRPG